jgi:hypothetical protein
MVAGLDATGVTTIGGAPGETTIVEFVGFRAGGAGVAVEEVVPPEPEPTGIAPPLGESCVRE